MSVADNLAVVQSSYAAFGRGDLATLLGNIAEDADWEFLGPKSLPFAGNLRGRAAVETRFFAPIAQTAEVIEFVVDRYIGHEDTVVVLGHERFRVKATGREWTSQWVHVMEMRGGKIVKFREYSDTAAVRDAYGA
jgi:ketosteroid isomerase-like protein